MSFPVIAASRRVLKDKEDQDKFPRLVEYSKRLEGIEGYKRAVTRIEQIDGKFQASM